jgi:hypothetical protein
MNDLRVDISDALLDKRFKGACWFIDDPRVVNVVRECHDGRPVIQRYLYRNLDRRGLCVPMYRQFHADRTMEYRCFYTGGEIYLTDGKLLGNGSHSVSLWHVPWAMTREHVAPRRNRDPQQVNALGNMVPCANFVNKLMCHMPLAMKLFERDYLRALAFDRSAMTYETAWEVRSRIIAFEQPFWFIDNYPWFPHAIKDIAARRAAEEFFDCLRRHEACFLALPIAQQRTYLERPCDLDIVQLAKSVLGIKVR